MSVLEESRLLGFLEQRTQQAWKEAVEELAPSIHVVDRDATRIWFAFWALDLATALGSPQGEEEMARLMDLEGQWHLADQLDRSVAFLYGAHYWSPVKKAVLRLASSSDIPSSLSEAIRAAADEAAKPERVDPSLILGITAVAFMALRQLGVESLEKVAARPAEGRLLPTKANQIVRERERQTKDGLFGFLKGLGRSYSVRWDERKKDAVFRAHHGQNIAMAGAEDEGDYRQVDYRRIDGPIPVECRNGSCGYCWVGVLAGRDNLSEISDYEKERLRYFGYDSMNDEGDAHPPIRLACQSECHGDVTLSVSCWNGELNRRFNEAPKKLGTS